MSERTHPLVLDLVAWVADRPRTYDEVMAAWRTSCPRLTIWEDAVDQGLVARGYRDGVAVVTTTPTGRALLAAAGRLPQPGTVETGRETAKDGVAPSGG